jgi:hypothetical protein
MKSQYKTASAVAAVVVLTALVFGAYAVGRRTGQRQAEADAMAGSAFSNALRVKTDVAMANALQSTNVAKVLRDLEGDMLLNAVLLGMGASPESTDADTAASAQEAFGALDRYIRDYPSIILTNRQAAPMIQRSKEQIVVWCQALTNTPKRAPWGVAFDRDAVIQTKGEPPAAPSRDTAP